MTTALPHWYSCATWQGTSPSKANPGSCPPVQECGPCMQEVFGHAGPSFRSSRQGQGSVPGFNVISLGEIYGHLKEKRWINSRQKFSLRFGVKIQLEDHIHQARIAGQHLEEGVFLNEEPVFLVGKCRAKHHTTSHGSKGLWTQHVPNHAECPCSDISLDQGGGCIVADEEQCLNAWQDWPKKMTWVWWNTRRKVNFRLGYH